MPHLPDLPDLSVQATKVYRLALDGEPIPPGTPGLAQLLTMGLVVDSHSGDDLYSAIEPRYPALDMIGQVHQHLTALTEFTGAMPGFLATLRDQFQALSTRHESIQHLTGRDLINDHIARQHACARTEIIAAQPGHRTPEDLSFSFDRDRGALERGVAMRTLYHSSVRRVATVGNWANSMAASGGEIRTFNGRFPRSIIFDRSVAFIPAHTGESVNPSDEAVMISEPLVVARLAYVFDLFWERAQTWFDRSDSGKDKNLATTSTQRAILRELCQGRTQAQAAKNLGIGPAWINEQLGQLRKKLGAQTLNEVIYWWATSPDHEVQD
ncbi:DNA-binding CsgD family transcriptional regulator [Streptomyces sp. 3212.3]|uniref:hypothetical protein n=1 Tax=Streptomyces sp. 3212.3 TaxID=1938846 RepID=UPI000E3A2A61|nr:hypothetical protein [Streptomyces sp. 3212.3]REE61387.1 DNA-binding CsgD family transcriptional regulator [Streptomyces sp. 3212.3]